MDIGYWIVNHSMRVLGDANRGVQCEVIKGKEMIIIPKWSSYQSYKDRKPPWIRFHRSILDNYDYHRKSADARALLPMLWLLASESDDPVSGSLRADYERIAFRLRLPVDTVRNAIAELLIPNEQGESLIQLNQSCNEIVTNPYPNRNQNVTPETETETEKTIVRSRCKRTYDDEFKKFWTAYPRRIGKGVAFKRWCAVVATYPPDDLIHAAICYATHCREEKKEERYILHPATFLNDLRWQDYCWEEQHAKK